ncbi:MAG: hypothetical protein C0599_03425 [Salinivirgaceae bacterium]|nr:MAG: hypothetical protein C0599_03425 [Salinivirgaceae bacterium]
MRRHFILIWIFILTSLAVFSQYKNLRVKKIPIADSVRIDSIQIIEGSLFLRSGSRVISDKLYNVNYKTGTLTFGAIGIDSITVVYRVMHPSISEPYFHKSKQLLVTSPRYEIPKDPNKRRTLFEDSEISRSGSISRGFTVGNNQDVTMSSSLNLQLSGKLTKDLNVVASITDNNIPVQPEGNTQQLQEFDKIFIRVYNEKVNLTLGDYFLERPTGTFLNVNKKLQGIQVENRIKLGKKDEKNKKRNENKATFKNSVSGAVSKGKYYRQQLEPIEGNQGPYKLRGANNERFIIIIAGSERVIIDGQEKKRGQQYDYVIDYNSAEISFNPSVPINNDMRIYVEFEYTDKNYTRFLAAEYAEIQHKNSRFWFNVVSESDSKNQPIDQELDQSEIDVLSSIGDNTDNAVVPNITEQEFDEDIALYAKADTLIGGVLLEYYYFSTNPDSAKYRLGFSLVGEGNGNYIQSTALTNGKIYEWVAPVNGEPQGSYEPVVLLAAPQSKQMVTAGGEIKYGTMSFSRIEMAWSHFDANTFSSLDANDDNGLAVNYEGVNELLGDSLSNLKVETKYQFVHKNFSPFERFRSAEFDRDWNISNLNIDADQHVAGLLLKYQNKKKINVGIGAQSFVAPNVFKGVKGEANYDVSLKFLNLNGMASYLKAQTDSLVSDFLRSKSSLGIPFWKLEAGLRSDLEVNTYKDNDQLLYATSYQYFQYEAYLKNRTIEGLEAELTGIYRIDHKTWNQKMTPEKERRGISLSTSINKNRKSTWRLIANYRQVKILNDSLIQTQLPDQHVSGRIENRSVFFNGIIRSSIFYEVSTGLESKKEYAYLEVELGQGNYVWIDRNENGVKELNEFEIAQIASEGNHIRIYIPTDEYISVYSNQFKQTLNINFRKWSVSKKSWQKLMARFSDQFSYSVSRKITDDNFVTYANPFGIAKEDTSLISTNSAFRNMFSFNRTNPVFGADLILNQSLSKNLLTNGFEGREMKTIELQTRWNITRNLTFINKGSLSDKSKTTAYFTANNYIIRNYKAENIFRIQPDVKYRFEITYKYDDKRNLKGEDVAIHHDGGVSFQYAAAQRSTLNTSFHYIEVKYNGTGNNSLTYELLNGLQEGTNYTWELGWNKQLSKHFQMSIQYNGRAGDDTNTIHIASMRVRAIF